MFDFACESRTRNAMHQFPDNVRRVLQASGWHEGRRVDIGKAVAAMEKGGFVVSPAARGVLEEFYGLTTGRFRFLHDCMWQGGKLGAFFPVVEELNLIASLVGETSCPLGDGGGGSALILPSGRILHVDDYWESVAFAESLEDYLMRIHSEITRFSHLVKLSDEQKPADWREDAGV